MIAKTIAGALNNRLIVIVAAAVLLAWGAYETMRMPVDVFPDLTAPTVTVVADAHGMAPEEVETLITFPIETALNGASGVRRVRSSTSVGSAVIWADFDWGTDIYQARQIVSEKLQLVRNSLPPDIQQPVMTPVTSIMGEIMFIALRSDQHNTRELRTTADWTIRRRLLAVTGVAQVIPIGGDTKQYQVIAKPERLAAYNVTLDQVIQAVRKTNENSSAGFVAQGGQEYLIRGIGRAESLEEIGETVITIRDDVPIMVNDVADVRIGNALKRGTGSYNAQPAVIIGIQKQPGANTLDLTERLDAELAEIEADLPQGMTLETDIFRQADFISVAIDNLVEALRDGTILVILIVFAFLMSGRATAITVLALPLSLVVAALVIKAFGGSINTMTLGGLTIALGVLVDDAIIVVENITRRLRENAAKPEGARPPVTRVVFDATREIQTAIVYATVIIMLVFVPIFFLSSVEGRLLIPLGLAYIVALAASLVVAVTITPVLSALFLPRSRVVQRGGEMAVIRSVKAAYQPILAVTITHWRLIAAAAAVLLGLALVALSFAGRAFLPDFNEGSLTISAVTLPGTSLEQSNELGNMVEERLLQEPEVVATSRRTGRAELNEHVQGVNAAEIDVVLDMQDRSKDAVLADIRQSLAGVPGMNINIGQPVSHRIDHMLSGTRANIAVDVYGTNLYELRRIAENVRGAVEGIPGLVDLSVEQQADIPLLTVDYNRNAIARHGLTIRDVSETVEAAMAGQPVSRILEGQANFDLVVRYPESARANLQSVRETLITTPSGAQMPLSALADIRRESGPNTISRQNVERKITVMANVSGRALLSVVNDIRRNVSNDVSVPSGYRIEYGGQFESAVSASRTLMFVGALVVIGIFLLLFMAFGAVRDALLVMINLPLALIGGVAGVFLSDGVLSVASIIGFITLFGIATRNGVMMIAHIRHLWEDGIETDFRRAVERGAMERLVPVLMTALTAGLALVPLALSAGEPGSEIQAPMAIVILFGLLSSTALNMIVVPAMYLRFGQRESFRRAETSNGLASDSAG